ncbi:MAG: DUF4981 domain-containing protein [Promicromonosporaceae bacterium]|nr:DUF4981 domain-containing protein [Promicromonosporaceae bacterium]
MFHFDGLSAPNRLPLHSLRREAEIDLDGTWRFQLRPSATAAPGSTWSEVTVPSLWTMDPRFDIPHYTNVAMPFDAVPPQVPTANPVGTYRRSFTCEPAPGRRMILQVGAAEGVLNVTLNGTFVGASHDSHLAAEFDITDALLSGDNELELSIAKWGPQSYLEDQDQWWQFGLARSVFCYTVPEVRLADVVVVADYDATTCRGALTVTAHTAGLAEQPEVSHRVRVTGLGGVHEEPVAPRLPVQTLPPGTADRTERPAPRFPEDFMEMVSNKAAAAPVPPEFRAIPNLFATYGTAPQPPGTATIALTDQEVTPWSAERPHLEDLLIELLDGEGAVVDSVRLRTGFRRVEIVGRDLLINGERTLIQGVNRHDFDPQTGRVITRERMRAELSLMKRCNVNAIRTAHYPNDPYLYDLADEFGFYVVDEANVEAHGFASTLPDDPLYIEPIVERVKRMVLRDRNHPSVITWSLGNESGYGVAHRAAAAVVRGLDPTRPVQYEGAVSLDWHGGHDATDVTCPMYPSFHSLESYSRDSRADRPLITCEYAYAHGNGTGGLAEYWRLFETLPGLQGGFVWQFMDHALDPDGSGRSKYGGDFGDTPNDGTWALNGLVFANLDPKPALFEAQALWSPLAVLSGPEELAQGRVRLRNRWAFSDLTEFRVTAQVATRAGFGAPVKLDLGPRPPGAAWTLDLPAAVTAALAAGDALAVHLSVSLRADTPWAPAGTEIAVHGVELPRRARPLPGGSPAAVNEHGTISHPLLVSGPSLSLWRALHENDNAFNLDQRFVRSGFFRLDPQDISVTATDGSAEVVIDYHAAFGDPVRHERRITQVGEGDYVFDETVTLPAGTRDGLRVGMEFTLVDGFDEATYVGLGPIENYPDRRAGARLGRWESPIDALYTPYVVPQSSGTRGGVDHADLTGPAGRVTAASGVPLHLTVSRHDAATLEGAAHQWELPASDATIVHLDVAHRGVGTALLGPDTQPRYRLFGTHYRWQWRLTLSTTRQTQEQP